MSPGRNALCPCGSGRKFKLCCGRAGASAVAPASAAPAP
ncbi:SEC-C metal-binding domain-containing protein, partial [Accumulibacter sp.]